MKAMVEQKMMQIPEDLYCKLKYLGIINDNERNFNVGNSNYSLHTIQPWSIWLDYPELSSFDHDIVKRVLRTKSEPGMSDAESRIMDYKKIKHICDERIRQLKHLYNDDIREELSQGI